MSKAANRFSNLKSNFNNYIMNIPINHKTIFLFDHSNYFSTYSNSTVEFDVANKNKSSSSANAQKLEPLKKTLWTSSVESAIEFARIVYDLFPENKLIRIAISKSDYAFPNNWNNGEQGLDNLLAIMGSIMPPLSQVRPLYEAEEFINLCKALNVAVNSIAQTSELQQGLSIQAETRKLSPKSIPNLGRIILFSSANRNIDQIQEFLNKAIEECNRNIEQVLKNETSLPLSCLKIQKVELVIIDVVPENFRLLYEKEVIKQNSDELRTRILSVRAGKDLPMKLIDLVKNFYELAVTSVTNIPMKEELNANSSANYDVDILHSKTLHDQLKVCRIIKSCTTVKEGKDTVCLKWSNPKTNISEFNFSSCSSRITPIDVNSRPASCLTSFLLGGRNVVLEVPRLNNSNVRISSHVLSAQGNEIFMHCLVCNGRSIMEDRSSNEDLNAKPNFRLAEFTEFAKSNTLFNLSNDNALNFNIKRNLDRFDKQTRKWPILYSETLVGNYFQLRKLLENLVEDRMSDSQFAEGIKVIEYFQHTDLKSESLVYPTDVVKKNFDLDLIQIFWNELEEWLKVYQDISEKHKALYNHAKKIRDNFFKVSEGVASKIQQGKRSDSIDVLKKESSIFSYMNSELEIEKLGKRRKFNRENGLNRDEKNLWDLWSNVLNEKSKTRFEFFGRVINPNSNITPLYPHLEDTKLPPGAKIQE